MVLVKHSAVRHGRLLGKNARFPGVRPDDQIFGITFLFSQRQLQKPGSELVILVTIDNVLGGCCCGSRVAGAAHAAIWLVDDLEPAVPGGILITQSGGAVCGAIVRQDTFPVGECLPGNAFQAGGKKLFTVVYRHDNADLRGHIDTLLRWFHFCALHPSSVVSRVR